MANEKEIPVGFKTVNNVELDGWQGPYASLAAAKSAVPVVMRLYRTVKVIEGSGIVEYVWKNGTADSDLILKHVPSDSPIFTGTPLVPTASDGDNSTQAANSQFVNNQLKRMLYLSAI